MVYNGKYMNISSKWIIWYNLEVPLWLRKPSYLPKIFQLVVHFLLLGKFKRQLRFCLWPGRNGTKSQLAHPPKSQQFLKSQWRTYNNVLLLCYTSIHMYIYIYIYLCIYIYIFTYIVEYKFGAWHSANGWFLFLRHDSEADSDSLMPQREWTFWCYDVILTEIPVCCWIYNMYI